MAQTAAATIGRETSTSDSRTWPRQLPGARVDTGPLSSGPEPDARIEPRVAEIHQEVAQHEDHRHHEDRRLDQGEVPVVDGEDHEPADARPGEDHLADERPAEE